MRDERRLFRPKAHAKQPLSTGVKPARRLTQRKDSEMSDDKPDPRDALVPEWSGDDPLVAMAVKAIWLEDALTLGAKRNQNPPPLPQPPPRN